MAKSKADAVFGLTIGLEQFSKGFAQATVVAEKSGRDAGIAFAKAFETAVGHTPIKPPVIPPPPKPKPPPPAEDPAKAAEAAAARIRAVEQREDALRTSASHKLTASIVADINELERKRRAAATAAGEESSKLARTEIQNAQKSFAEQKAILQQALRERSKVPIGVPAPQKGGGFLGGLVGGFSGAALVGGLEQVIEKGKRTTEQIEGMERGFAQAGLQGKAFDDAMKANAKSIDVLSDKYAVSKGDLRGLTAAYLQFGGSSDNLAVKQETIIGLAKRAGISYEQAAKALSKGTDPEIEAQLTKMGIKFEKNATEADRFRIIQEKVGGGLEKLAEQAKGPLGSFERFQNSIGSLASTLGVTLIEALGPIASLLAEAIKPIVEIIKPILKSIGPIVSSIITPIIGIVTTLIGPITDIFTTLAPVVTQFATVLGSVLGPVLSEIVGIIATVLKPVLETFGAILTPIIGVFGDLATIVGGAFAEIIGVLQPFIPQLLAPLLQIFTQIAGLWKGELSLAAKVVADVLKIIASVISDLLATALPPIIDALQAFADLFPILVSVVTPFIDIIGQILKPVLEALRPILGVIVKLIAEQFVVNLRLLTPLIKLFGTLLEALMPLLVGSKDNAGLLTLTIKSLADSLNVILPVIADVVQGFSDALDAVSSFLGGAEALQKKTDEITNRTGAAGNSAIDSFVTKAKTVELAFSGLQTLLAKIKEQEKILTTDVTPENAQANKAAFDELEQLKIAAFQAFEARKKALSPTDGKPGDKKPPPPAPKPAAEPAKIDFTSETVAAEKAAQQARAAVASDAVKNATANELQLLEIARKEKQSVLDQEVKDKKDAANAKFDAAKASAAKEGKPFVEDGRKLNELLLALDTELAEKTKVLDEQNATESAKIRRKLTEDGTKQEIEELQRRQSLITAETAAALQQRFDIEREIRARQRTLAKPEELQKFDAETVKANADAETAIRLKARQESIDALATEAERTRATELASVQDKLDEELKRFKLNEVAKIDAIRKAAAERAKIEEKHLDETSRARKFEHDFAAALEAAFTGITNTEARERAKAKLDELDKEQADLRAKALAGAISLDDFLKGFQSQQIERDKAQNAAKLNANDAFHEAGIRAAAAFEKSRQAESEKSTTALISAINDREGTLKAIHDDATLDQQQKDKASAAVDADIATKRNAAIADTATSGIATILSLVAQGKDASKSFLLVLIDTVEKAIPAFIALIFGKSISEMPFGLGLIEAIALTGIIEGLLSLAKNQIGAAEGEVPIRGIGGPKSDNIIRLVSPGEGIANARAVAAGGPGAMGNEEALRWANRTGNPLREYFQGGASVVSASSSGRVTREEIVEMIGIHTEGLEDRMAGVERHTETSRKYLFNIQNILSDRLAVGGSMPSPSHHPSRK